MEYALIIKNDTLLWWAYNNLGNIYSEERATVEKGFHYYNKAIEISTRLEDPENNVTPLLNKGWTHIDMKQYDKAFPYLEKVEGLSAQMTDPFLSSQLPYLYGRYYAGKGEYEKSKNAFKEAITTAEKDSLFHEASLAYQQYAKLLFDHDNLRPLQNIQ